MPPLGSEASGDFGRLAGPHVGSGDGRRKAGGGGALSSFHPWPLQGPPNFLRASALAEHIKPVVVIPEEAPEDEEPENLIEISTGPPAAEPVVSVPLLSVCVLGVTGPPSVPYLPWLGGWGHRALLWQVVADLFDQTFGPPNGSVKDDR